MKTGQFVLMLLFLTAVSASGQEMLTPVNLAEATIVHDEGDLPLVKHMAQVLAEDIERVSGARPQVRTRKSDGPIISIGTVKQTKRHRELQGTWERFAIDTEDGNLYITGSDARGLAYGVFHISEAIGVNPWYWFADVPVDKANKKVFSFAENYVSDSPSIKYRGVFLNDEDWGLRHRSQDL